MDLTSSNQLVKSKTETALIVIFVTKMKNASA